MPPARDWATAEALGLVDTARGTIEPWECDARCTATFDIRVLPPKTYRRQVAAGERVQIHHRVKRAVNRMIIDLSCAPDA